MFIKIYFDDVPVILSEFSDPIVGSFSAIGDQFIFNDPNEEKVEEIIRLSEAKLSPVIVVTTTDLEQLKKVFFSKFTIITAGGGIIRNGANEILMIFRRGKWDLPKGKLDEGETIEECSVREVREETGLTEISVLDKLTTTYHTYREKGKHILKESHWYIMSYHGFETAIPQVEEQITEIRWVGQDEMSKFFENTYPIIQEIIEQFSAINTE